MLFSKEFKACHDLPYFLHRKRLNDDHRQQKLILKSKWKNNFHLEKFE